MSPESRLQEILDKQIPNSLDTEPIVTKEELTNHTEQKNVEESEILAETSTGSGKVALPVEYLDQIVCNALRTLGIDEDDVILNLGAPQPHLSGIGIKRGGEAVGAEVLTDHSGEVEDIIERSNEVTTVFSLPGMAKAKGKEIAEKWGKPAKIFSPEKGIMAGEILTESYQELLVEQWGFDEVRETYASSEVGTILAEVGDNDLSEHRKLVPQLDNVIIEIYPLSGDQDRMLDPSGISPKDLIDIREISEPTEGILYPTIPNYIHRYEQADIVQIIPGENMSENWPDELPAVEPLGRLDCLNIAGAMVPEGKIERTLTQATGEDLVEWSIKATGNRENPKLQIYTNKKIDQEKFTKSLENNAHDLFYANNHGMINCIKLRHVDDPVEQVEDNNGVKINRMEDSRC